MLIIFCAALVFRIGRCTDDQSFAVKTVPVGEDVTLTCSRQSASSGFLFWIRLVVGRFPEVLAATYTFNNGNIIETPRITAKQGPGTFVLHITKTQQNDTAFYYCEQKVELKTTFWNKTFLEVKGPETEITAIIQDLPPDPVRPGDSVTLQCSVLSDSQKKTCPGDHSVYWFRAGSDESHPGVLYARGNSGDECEKSPEAHSLQKCVYSFSKNISSSDAGTYYCAVATCGEILFGNGTKVDVDASNTGAVMDSHGTVAVLLFVALALSLIIITFLIYCIRKNGLYYSNRAAAAAAALQRNAANAAADQQNPQTYEDSLIYCVPDFSGRKAGCRSCKSVRRGANAAEGGIIYSDVRAFPR